MKVILFAIFNTVLAFILSYVIDTYHQIPSAIIVCFAISCGYAFGTIGSFLESQKTIKEIMKNIDKNE